jgi:outer membrane immunogenic protein
MNGGMAENYYSFTTVGGFQQGSTRVSGTYLILTDPQQSPQIEVFGGYSYLNFHVPATLLTVDDRINANGWQASTAVRIVGRLSAEANFSGHYKSNCSNSGLNCSNFSFMGGPRLSFGSGNSKVTGFVHGLFGMDRISAGFLGVSASNNSMAAAAGGGVDYWLTRHVGIRVAEVDYFFTRHFNDLDVRGRSCSGKHVHALPKNRK